MPNWPEGLPGPILDGYSGSQSETFRRFEYSTGVTISRLWNAESPFFVNANFFFNNEQMQKFMGFVEYEVNGNSEWFNMNILLPDGDLNRSLRMVGSYKDLSPAGSSNNWTVSVQFELQERPIISEQEYRDLLDANAPPPEYIEATSISNWSFRENQNYLARIRPNMVVKSGRVYIIGGRTNTYLVDGDVWSMDYLGGSLVRHTEYMGASMYTGGCLLFGNNIYVLSGRSYGSSATQRKVAVSSDATNWTIYTDTTEPSTNIPRNQSFGCIEAFGKIWMIGGNCSDEGGRTNKIWSSTNGLNWVEEGIGDFSPRECYVFKYAGKFWMIGGYVKSAGGDVNEIWSSTNLINWTREPVNFPTWVSTNAFTEINGVAYIIVRNHDVYYSSDGLNWTRDTANDPNNAGVGTTVYSVGGYGRFFLVEGYVGKVWYSYD